MKSEINIQNEFITLGQLLKLAGIIDSGGTAKWFLQENKVLVNGEEESRRGRKLYVGDHISIDGYGEYIVTS
ncbi:S4 domain-containing protein YaaA [Pueribacillus theae]|uniref:S4 domain-containing protein YaaA n=1 Tax=Pueribacillus theae TaxID=2171751 RepID=A0A2U1K538_9BACI|nr:S4 domain-containing protein YaaA [Pueribacillus theae]PWA12068.1 S4 domain-containing protein YaaA [Pueribacillus theae]